MNSNAFDGKITAQYIDFKGGKSERLAEKIAERWLIGIAESNPAILSVFTARDILPYRDCLAWSGEFAGKYLTSAYYVFLHTKNMRLKRYVITFIERLLSSSDKDYFGCFSKSTRFSGARSQFPQESSYTWDVWSHYHIAYGLFLWYTLTGEARYKQTAEQIALSIGERFYGAGKSIADNGCAEMNQAIYHLFWLFFNVTGNDRYRMFAESAEKDMKHDKAGDWLDHLAAGKPFYQCKKPRWESLHLICGFAEAFRATNDEKYLVALRNCVDSVLENDVHNTGGFSTNEQATGNPFENGVIETCCVVAFNAVCIELYKLRPEIRLIDFLERAHYNAAMGAVSPSGAWATYDTPMEGEKFANFHGCDFQSRPGAPMLNCCSVNFPRGISSYTEWAFFDNGNTIFINGFESAYYHGEAGTIRISGNPLISSSRITCNINGRKILLRIPSYADAEIVRFEDDATPIRAEKGKYFPLDAVCDIKFTMKNTAHFFKGDKNYAGKYSLYRGPVLFACEVDENPALGTLTQAHAFTLQERLNAFTVPAVDYSDFADAPIRRKKDGTLFVSLKNGVVLTEFSRCGFSGSLYKTWFELNF